MFSRRTGWPRTTNRLTRLVEAARRGGRTLLDLTETNPTRAGLRAPLDLLALLGDPGAREYDPQPLGLHAAREAVAADYGRRGVAVGPERILLTSSTSEAYAFLFKLLGNPDDAVLVPTPSYPLFAFLAGLESLTVETYPMVYDGEWHLVAEEVERRITRRTRALVVVSPNNPTGSFVKLGEADALRRMCAERDVALVSDEVFADYAWGEDARRAVSLFEDGEALTFSLGGLSKAGGLPQLKLGWVAVSGPANAREEALGRLEFVADTYLSVSTPVQHAAPWILARMPELQEPIAARVRLNLDTLDRFLGPTTPVTLLRPEGGWSAVLRVPATLSEDDWVERLLVLDGVLVHPGYFFDFDQEAYLVVSLIVDPDDFALAVHRLIERVIAETGSPGPPGLE